MAGAGARSKTTTQRGLGWDHQKARAQLLARHRDGRPCPCTWDGEDGSCGDGCLCRPHGVGQPMYRDAARNPDGLPLDADHTESRSQGGQRADRLMLATCNRSRGAGTRGGLDVKGPAPWHSRAWL